MNSYIFDTSFLISLLDIDDINHIKALEIISFFKMISWKVSIADSSVLYDSFKHNLKILTFDKEMIKLSEKYKV